MTSADESKSAPELARLSDDIPTLEAEAARFSLQREKTLARIRELMAAEDLKAGITHHEEIFQLQQDKLRYDVEIKFRQNKINRINLGITEKEMQRGPSDGFLF